MYMQFPTIKICLAQRMWRLQSLGWHGRWQALPEGLSLSLPDDHCGRMNADAGYTLAATQHHTPLLTLALRPRQLQELSLDKFLEARRASCCFVWVCFVELGGGGMMKSVFGRQDDPQALGDPQITLKGTISASVIWGGGCCPSWCWSGQAGAAFWKVAKFSSQEWVWHIYAPT